MRKLFYIPGVVLLALTLTACGGNYDAGRTSDNPVPVENTGFDVENIRMPDGTVVTCLSENVGNRSAVLTCVEAKKQDIETVPLSETPYEVNYIKLDDGTQLQCLLDGAGRSAVISCVTQLR